LVVVPAGNHGISFVSETYRDTNDDGWHEFEWGYPALWAAPIQTEMFGEAHLRWQDVFTSAQIDLDLYIFTEDRSALWDAATELQKGRSADWPYEDAFYPTQAGVPVYIGIRAKNPGTIPDGTRYYLYVDDTLLGFSTPSGSIIAPADSPKVITVGAIEASEALWQRSARGPTWDGRIKPDMVAPTRLVLTSTDEIFTGTSASAPIVAAAAAITRGAFPNLNEVEVRHWLVSNAIDLGEPGADNDFGAGRLWLPPPVPD
jgi:subtilisin family serine protease